MRKDTLYIFGSLALFAWAAMTYFLFVHRPNNYADVRKSKLDALQDRIQTLEARLNESLEESSAFLAKMKLLLNKKSVPLIDKAFSSTKEPKKHEQISRIENSILKNSTVSDEKRRLDQSDVIPVLMFACNRVTVNVALDSLLKARKNPEKFPIIVSEDCGHQETTDVIRGYGDKVIFMQQPDLSDIEVPANERKFKGYFKIARHYGWALNETLNRRGYHQIIIVEDDLEFAEDFFEYFEATLPILRSDPTLWCVSAWNDNGKRGLIDETKPELLYRTDFFGGLGWMMTRELWMNELSSKWPRSYWDDWMRLPEQRKNRACIRPEVGRTKTFGKIGVSNGLFFDKHLKFIQLNENPVLFKTNNMDLTYLIKDRYDKDMDKLLNQDTPVVSLTDVRQGATSHKQAVKILYRTRDNFKSIAKVLGIMDDFKSGVPRMAYKGVVSTMYRGQRVYVAPNLNWKGYDPSWKMAVNKTRASSSISVDDHLRAPVGAIKKVPGEVAPLGRLEHEAKAFEKEIRTKNCVQLQELLERQVKILENASLVKKLPDKGEKVRKRKAMIEALIEERTRSLNEAADLLAALTIGGSGAKNGAKIDCDEMEWKFGGGHLFRKLAPASDKLDSDDDSDDSETDSANPLKVLATRELPTSRKEKSGKENRLSSNKAEDLTSEIRDPEAEDKYVEYLSKKVDNTGQKVRFIPFKSAELKTEKSKVLDASSSTVSLQHTSRPDRPIKNRQIEVMPLPSENYARASVKLVPLQESLQLEREQAQRLKEIQLKHAMERLGAFAGVVKMKEADLTAEERMAYRDRVEGSDFNVDEEDEVADEDEGTSDGIKINFIQTELEEQ